MRYLGGKARLSKRIAASILGVATLLAGLMRTSHRTAEWERALWGEDHDR